MCNSSAPDMAKELAQLRARVTDLERLNKIAEKCWVAVKADKAELVKSLSDLVDAVSNAGLNNTIPFSTRQARDLIAKHRSA